MKTERKRDGEMCMHAVRVIQTSVSVELFCSLVSPGQGRALVSFSLSMSGQDCLAAECSAMQYVQEFGIYLRANEQEKTDGQVWGRKEMLSILFTDGGTCVGLGLLLLPKTFNKGIF